LYKTSRSNWEKEQYTESCTVKARKGIIWWKIGDWRLNIVMRNNEKVVKEKNGAPY
jgi:hypothetical protein